MYVPMRCIDQRCWCCYAFAVGDSSSLSQSTGVPEGVCRAWNGDAMQLPPAHVCFFHAVLQLPSKPVAQYMTASEYTSTCVFVVD